MNEIFAEVGAFLLFFVNIPQLLKTWKNRNELKDLSLTTQALYFIVGVLYFIYGFSNNLVILWIYNVFGAFYFTLTIYLILRCKRRSKSEISQT